MAQPTPYPPMSPTQVPGAPGMLPPGMPPPGMSPPGMPLPGMPVPGLALPTGSSPANVGFRESLLAEEKSKKRKRDKRGKRDKRYRSSSSSSDEECKCKAECPPATQIFISPPGASLPPQPQYGDYGAGSICSSCNSPKRPGDQQQTSGGPSNKALQGYMDASKMCAQNCWGGGRTDDVQTQVVCCPTQSQKKSKRKTQSAKNYCTCCSSGSEAKKKKKQPQYGTMEGMMPATQQFLMFLQAYGLAAALIRDRNRREDERAAKDEQKRLEERKSSKSASRRSSSKSADRSKTPAKKDKDKKKEKK